MKEKYFITLFVVLITSLTFTFSSSAIARPSLSGLKSKVEELQEKTLQQQELIDALSEQLSPPVEIHLPAVFRGRYESDGAAFVGNNFFVGAFDDAGNNRKFRNFFVFDLSSVFSQLDLPQGSPDFSIKIVNAELFIFNPQDGFLSTNSDTETYILNRVGSPFDGHGDPVVFNLINGIAGVELYTDLADGPGYGSYVASVAQNRNTLVIGLSSQRAIHDLNRKVNGSTDGGPFPDPNSRLFAVGGSISTLNDVVDTEGLFSSSTGSNPVSLLLNVKVESLL